MKNKDFEDLQKRYHFFDVFFRLGMSSKHRKSISFFPYFTRFPISNKCGKSRFLKYGKFNFEFVT